MTFQRESRYIVVKLKDLAPGQEADIREHLTELSAQPVDSLVIERDWPEYEPAWRMIQARVEGLTLSPAYIEDGEEVEVVGTLIIGEQGWDNAIELNPGPVMALADAHPKSAMPLMTVAQHQRIKAALSADNQRVLPPEPILAAPHPMAAPSAPPAAGTTSDQYRAELYDEVWQKARDMGYGNVTDALVELERIKADPPAAGVSEEWQPMETAPTDGTLLRLLVEFEDHPIEDGAGPFATVGTNYRDNTGEDAWQIVGWCWEQDRFIDGVGTPVGWLPMLIAAPNPPASEQQRAVVMPEITGTAIVEVVNGVEGPSLYIGDEDGGYRLAGPKPWGGGRTIHKFTVKLNELVREAMDLAKGEGV